MPIVDATFTILTDKTSKICYRFYEDAVAGQPEKIGTIYVKKWTFPKGQPKKIRVVVEVVE